MRLGGPTHFHLIKTQGGGKGAALMCTADEVTCRYILSGLTQRTLLQVDTLIDEQAEW